MIKTLRNLFKQDKEKFAVPKSVQAVIPLKTMWEDGIFLVGRNKYAKTFKFEDMNTQLGLRSIVRPKNPGYEHRKPHKVFENKLKQDFHADKVNQKWCTDFTYLFLANHEVRYNCTIPDLHDRSVVASITDRHITSDLAIRTLQKALDSQPAVKRGLILHSDQGCQYTSKTFVEFCESVHVTQSMSRMSLYK